MNSNFGELVESWPITLLKRIPLQEHNAMHASVYLIRPSMVNCDLTKFALQPFCNGFVV